MDVYYNPVRAIWGPGSFAKLEEVLESLSSKRIALFCGSRSFKESGCEEKLLPLISRYKIVRFDRIPSHPDISDVLEIHRQAKNYRFDTFIAIGGGSVLDMAKAIKAASSLDLNSEEDLRKIIGTSDFQPGHEAIVAIPTTSGSGSELTKWATVWDKDNQKKYSIDHPALYPDFALVDPSLTYSLTLRTSVTSGLDALCHAVEAYWAKESNECSRAFSLTGASRILVGLEQLFHQELKEEARNNLSLGSLNAGYAFSHTRTTACHAMAYPLTLRYGIEHGIAVTMTLASILLYNLPYLNDQKALFAALKIDSPNDLQERVNSICSRAGIKTKLRDYGVNKEELAAIAAECFTKGRMDNNPYLLTVEEVNHILHHIY
ncbi:phosphonoacetaldehyde reductase [Paenibacillus nanensis]|nr:phosphonoacetaldehyde reductase [Paenibacillus nanensis]